MNFSTNKQMRNILTVRKHRKQASRKAMKKARQLMAEAITNAVEKCDCPQCRAERGAAGSGVGHV